MEHDTMPSYTEAEALTGLPDPVLTVKHQGTMPVRMLAARSGITGQTQLPDTSPHQVLGRNPARRSATVLNTSTATVYVGFSQNITTTNGFPLAAGASLTVETTDELWAVTGTPGATLALLALNEDGS